MSWSVLQSASNSPGGGATVSVTLPSALSSGTTLIAVGVCFNGTGTSVKDAANNSFVKIASQLMNNSAASGDVSLWALNTPAGDVGATPSITFTSTGSSAILVQEVSGLATGTTAGQLADGTAGVLGGQVPSTGGTTGTPSYTSSASGEYLVYVYGDTGQGVTYTGPAGYTGDAHNVNGSTNNDIALFYKNSTGGTETGTWTLGAGSFGNPDDFGLILAAFQLSGAPPSFAHDAQTVDTAFTTTGAHNITHAASSDARAACVIIDQNGTATDEVSGVTYGGAAMTRLRSDTESTEAGRVYVYWLDGITAGSQTVTVTTTAGTNKQAVVFTMTASPGASVAVAGHNSGTSASASNPSWTITGLTAGIKLEAYEGIHSGLTTMTNTPAASWTLVSSTDLTAQGRGFARQEIASSGTSLTCGWQAATADDFVGSAAAFSEVAAAPAVIPDLVMAPMTGA